MPCTHQTHACRPPEHKQQPCLVQGATDAAHMPPADSCQTDSSVLTALAGTCARLTPRCTCFVLCGLIRPCSRGILSAWYPSVMGPDEMIWTLLVMKPKSPGSQHHTCIFSATWRGRPHTRTLSSSTGNRYPGSRVKLHSIFSSCDISNITKFTTCGCF